MLYSIHAFDANEDSSVRRDASPAHKEHLDRAAEYGVRLVIGGPLLDAEDQFPIGSLMVFEAQDAAAVRRFNQDDPFLKMGVWSKVHLAQFDRRT